MAASILEYNAVFSCKSVSTFWSYLPRYLGFQNVFCVVALGGCVDAHRRLGRIYLLHFLGYGHVQYRRRLPSVSSNLLHPSSR